MQQVTAEAPQKDFQGDAPKKNEWRNLEEWKQTPLLRVIDNASKNWLLSHAVERYQAMHNNLFSWRQKMQVWERQSEGDFSDRKAQVDPVNNSTAQDIFAKQNDTLGLVNGFCDFHYSQAKDDLFGTRPWLAVTPEGSDDTDLADHLSKHCQWKFAHSDLEPTLLDALKVSTWGGTAFVKTGWHREAEQFAVDQYQAYNGETGEPILDENGQPITEKETVEALIQAALEAGAEPINAEAVEWKLTGTKEEAHTIYANVTGALVDYHDIAFDPLAPALDLRHTDVFVKFKMGLLDAMEKHGIPESRRRDLLGAYTGYDDTVRNHRDETGVDFADGYEERANPQITLVEGFMRCKPSADRPMARIHIIFSPELHALFKADFLANVTPNGLLPVFPVRINKIPKRIFGKGYFEKFENFNNAVDRQYNRTTYNNLYQQHVYTAVNPSALKDGGEGFDVDTLDPKTPYELAIDKVIDDFLQFKVMPENNSRSIELMNQMMQMAQMISGITSAAQGELKGVPNATTATGVKDLQSRGATILKAPIDEQKTDFQALVEFDVHVLYANHDTDETFTWTEGNKQELLTIKANDVAGLRANVTLTMSQSQNMRKIESADAAIKYLTTYLQLPEMDKVTAKPLFKQALSALGFDNAEDILRDGVVDLQSLLEIAPPDLQPAIMLAAEQMAQAPPPAPGMEGMPADPNTPLAPVDPQTQL